ncbi:carboxymuconolactone decarboxylase family protein [Schleiferilactobacillus harbinensis]|jgi:4-carboxymuconolactone decarboxylase|uniref:carboxymuconolactone decarboxylase family protein n=1 Tax=Schleiferilactobacillus harbinensis TaxID=304207 RepID=UPI00242BF925|nr:carboxymuconolactone decarboxylase family protein [Schleiferilactobacillus harbinensis]MCI1851444.1 carboxymuconolactone decarboxylase family protein [Schleiferilactobacillus harbinensis]
MTDQSVLAVFEHRTNPLVHAVAHAGAMHLTRDRLLIPLIASICQGVQAPITAQTEAILAAGIDPQVMLEVVYQLTPVVGTLRVAQALPAIQRVFTDQHVAVTAAVPDQAADFGNQTQAELYGTEIKHLLHDLPDGAGDFIPAALTNHFFNDYYRYGVLSVKDRERYELLALITLNVDFQIKAHARGSLKAGNTESELVWSAIQLLPYIGFPLVINSVRVIHDAATALAE